MRAKKTLAYFAFFFAIVFALLGLLLPPMGVIDASVNMLIAQLLVLCATLLGIKSFDFPSPQNKKPPE